VNIDLGLWWMVPYPEPPPEMIVHELPPEPAPRADSWEEPAAEPAQEEGAAELDRIPLAPPERYPVEDRGFFDGDRLFLEAFVLDRTTGEALWVKRLSRKADPRDPRAVKEAVDGLLSEGGWQAPWLE
jgi:hypothetical protein